MTKSTVPPRRIDPFDAMIGALQGLSVATRALKDEVHTLTSTLADRIDVQTGRVNGLASASRELADEVRQFGKSKERLIGRISALELLQEEETGNGHA